MSYPRLQVLTIGNEDWVAPYRNALIGNGIWDDRIDIHVSPYGASRDPNYIIEHIERLNISPHVSGIIGLTPTPDAHYDAGVYNRIAPEKDVDCQTQENFKAFLNGDESVPFAPATAEAVKKVIEEQWFEHLKVAVLGKWPAVGLPLTELLRRDGIEHVNIESWERENPNWEQELRESKANVVVWAARWAHCITPKNLPIDTLKYGIDVAYCERNTHGNWEKEIVGNFSPWVIGMLDGDTKNYEVGRATTKQLIEHVIRAHEIMNSNQ